eukprot:m.333600 g.333600  ORF g.333600 m.333600 type:complete len:150 (+) comp17181_c0_seq1:86-535(+)
MTAGYHEVQYDDGDQYAGDWNNEGKREGFGVLTFADGSRYSGNFVGGLCQGHGVLTFTDNSKYEGEFQSGKFHGFGIYHRGDGMKFEGQFRDGHVHGSGLLTFSDGTCGQPRQEGEWDGGRLVRRGKAHAAVTSAGDAAVKARSVARIK